MRARGLLLVVLVGMLVACGLPAQAATSYETCFAFDPVFVQADQRRAPPVAEKPASVPAARPKGKAEAPQPPGQDAIRRVPRMPLTTVSRALKALLGTARTADVKTEGR